MAAAIRAVHRLRPPWPVARRLYVRELLQLPQRERHTRKKTDKREFLHGFLPPRPRGSPRGSRALTGTPRKRRRGAYHPVSHNKQRGSRRWRGRIRVSSTGRGARIRPLRGLSPCQDSPAARWLRGCGCSTWPTLTGRVLAHRSAWVGRRNTRFSCYVSPFGSTGWCTSRIPWMSLRTGPSMHRLSLSAIFFHIALVPSFTRRYFVSHSVPFLMQ